MTPSKYGLLYIPLPNLYLMIDLGVQTMRPKQLFSSMKDQIILLKGRFRLLGVENQEGSHKSYNELPQSHLQPGFKDMMAAPPPPSVMSLYLGARLPSL